jgi:hypothetical protein
VVLVSSKIASPSQTPRPRVGRVASQVDVDWAAPSDRGSGSKSAAAAAAAALAAAASAAAVAVAVWERQRRVAPYWLGQPGAAWSGQEVCSGFAPAAHTTPSRLGLRPRGSRYALVARAAAAAAVAAAAVEATAANARPRRSGFALASRLRPLRPRGSRYALAARLRPHTTIKQQSSGRKSCFGSAAAYLPQR